MKIRNYLFLAICLLIVGCHRNKMPEGWTWKPATSISVRRTANEEVPICLKDRYKVEILKNDISLLQQKMKSTTGNVIFQNIQLKNTPQEVINLIQNFSPYISTKQNQFTKCTDFLCVLKEQHQSKADLAALSIYWWFLKTGYWLGQSSSVPQLNTSKIDEEYQFSIDEIQAFWISSLLLPSHLTYLPTLKTMHRFPKGQVLSRNPEACGEAHSPGGIWSFGFIYLMDNCLRLSKDTKISDMFFLSVFHEIAHSKDYAEQILSEDSLWKSFSGWEVEEYQDNGQVRRRWSLPTIKDGFYREYSRSSPREDWADSVAAFRSEPDIFVKSAPGKSDFISKKIFDGRYYTQQALMDYYVSYIESQILSKDLLRPMVEGCFVSQENKVSDEAYFSSFIPDLTKKLDACLTSELEKVIRNVDQVLVTEEWEYCGYRDSSFALISKKIAENLAPKVNELIRHNANYEEQLVAYHKVMQYLENQIVPHEILFQSLSENDFKEQYLKSLDQILKSKIQYFKLTEQELISRLEKTALKNWDFDKALHTLESIYRNILSQSDIKLQMKGKDLWDLCMLTSDGNINEPKMAPYNGGDLFVPSGILNCINESSEKIFFTTLHKEANKIGLDFNGPHIERILKDIFWPSLKRSLDARLNEEYEKEKSKLKNQKMKLQEDLDLFLKQYRNTNQNPRQYLSQCSKWVDSVKLPSKTEYRFLTPYEEIISQLRSNCQKSYEIDYAGYEKAYFENPINLNLEVSFFESILLEKGPQYLSNECKDLKTGQRRCYEQKTLWKNLFADSKIRWSEGLKKTNFPNQLIQKFEQSMQKIKNKLIDNAVSLQKLKM